MKKILTFFISLLISISAFTQTPDNLKKYKDLGIWSLNVGENKVSIEGYITKDTIKTVETENKYVYKLFLVSHSRYQGELTNTWVYNAKIFINGDEITKNQFPNGFTISVHPEPTKVYETINENNIDLTFTWKNSTYEPRILSQR